MHGINKLSCVISTATCSLLFKSVDSKTWWAWNVKSRTRKKREKIKGSN